VLGNDGNTLHAVRQASLQPLIYIRDYRKRDDNSP
jgi:hypothetical protein